MRNPRHERFSQLVASGVRPKESYTAVGYKPTGAKQAASRLLTNVDIRDRVSELQKTAARSTAEALILNRERVLHRLSELSHEAQQTGHHSAAARCEELIGKEIGMFVDRTALLWDLDPDKLTPAQLDVIADHLLKQVLGDNPKALAEVDRRLLAGETPTMEEVQKAIEAPEEPRK